VVHRYVLRERKGTLLDGRAYLLVALVTAFGLLSGCAAREPMSWSDDFSDAGSGWKAESDASAEADYWNGVMRILVKVPNRLAWVSMEREMADFRLTVDATQFAGPDDNEYGVLVRMMDAGHFYRFAVSGDGYYLVSKYDGEVWFPLTGDWAPSSAIRSGQATNQMEIVCEGSYMRFNVNGELVAEVRDDSYPKGSVGLYAGSFFEPGVEVHFDNLTVTAP